MKILGYWLIAIGVVYLFFAFNMEVSVSTASTYIPGYGSVGGGEVANLDLMARRQNHLIVAALITLIGTLMAIFGPSVETGGPNKPEAVQKDFAGERDLGSDRYRLWLVSTYGIERNEVFGRFVLGEQTFMTLTDALTHAHQLEMTKISDEAAEKERLQTEALAMAEAKRLEAERAEAEWQETRPKLIIALVIVVALCVGAYFVFRETPAEREARLAQEKAERVAIEQRFHITFPADANGIDIMENAKDYAFLCNDKEDGKLLKFSTRLTPSEVKDLFVKTLGDGEAMYGSLPEKPDWIWNKAGVRYEMRIFQDTPPVEVNFCMTK